MSKSAIQRNILILVILLISRSAWATNYYVDFDAGSNSNNGTSISNPWLSIPGTRNAGNSGYVTPTVSVQAGDTIWLKSGTTWNSTKGGMIQIRSAYYANGTSSSPITIKRKTDWGSGQILINGAGMTTGSWAGLIDIQRQYIVIDGAVQSGILIENAPYSNVYQYLTGIGGATIQNIEVYNSSSAGIRLATSNKTTPGYVTGNTLRNIIAHTTQGTSDTDADIYVEWQDGFVIDNVVAYDACKGAPQSCDGIHVSSSKNGWVINSTAYSNGEQGIDLSLDGDYKTRDDGYNVTVRDCIAWNNPYGNYDQNSGIHDAYFIRNVGWKGVVGTTGNGDFSIYQGTRSRNFYINNTSSAGNDWGFQVTWDWGYSSGYGLPTGSFDQVFINNNVSGDAGYSINMESDQSSHSFNPVFYTNNFNSARSTTAASVKGINYTKANINAKSGGWPGTNDKAVDPLFVDTVGSVFSDVDLRLQASSPMIDAGAFPFSTNGSGSGTVVIIAPIASNVDATRVFRAGDSVQIESSGTYTIASVDSATKITLTGSATWASGKGFWFPWNGTRPDIGAYEYGSAAIKKYPSPAIIQGVSP